MGDNGKVLVFSGRANPGLAMDICKYMDIGLGRTVIKAFSDGEIYVEVGENVVSALMMANQAAGGFRMENHAGRRAQMLLNDSFTLELEPF